MGKEFFSAEDFKQVLKAVGAEYGCETFITDGYAAHDDIIHLAAQRANQLLRERGARLAWQKKCGCEDPLCDFWASGGMRTGERSDDTHTALLVCVEKIEGEK